MLSIFKIDKINFYFPHGIDKLPELLRRSLEVVEPLLTKNWNNLIITYNVNKNKLLVVLNQSQEIILNKYSSGYLHRFIDEMTKNYKPKVIQIRFKNINKNSPLSYDLLFGG